MRRVVTLLTLSLFWGNASLAQDAPSLNVDAAKEYCAKEWEDDFSMQEFCLDQIKTGFDKFVALYQSEEDPVMIEAFSNCRDEWGIDWGMVHFCAEQQIDGRGHLPRVLSEVPEDVASRIRSKCQSEWHGDFSMAAFCAEQNVGAWKRLNQ